MSQYKINVAKLDTSRGLDPRYLHFCLIELGDIPKAEAQARAKVIVPLFPAPGYKLEVIHWQSRGALHDPGTFINEKDK